MVESNPNNEYTEEDDSTVSHDGGEYSVNKLLAISRKSKVHTVPVSMLSWNIEPTDMDSKRIHNADVSVPVLITPYKDKVTVIDGAHRIAKSMGLKLPYIQCKYVTPDMLDKCRV